MNKDTIKKVASALAMIALFIAAVALISNTDPYNKLVSGNYDLSCEFAEGSRSIDPAMVKYEIDGYWKFENGGASNCRLTKK